MLLLLLLLLLAEPFSLSRLTFSLFSLTSSSPVTGSFLEQGIWGKQVDRFLFLKKSRMRTLISLQQGITTERSFLVFLFLTAPQTLLFFFSPPVSTLCHSVFCYSRSGERDRFSGKRNTLLICTTHWWY